MSLWIAYHVYIWEIKRTFEKDWILLVTDLHCYIGIAHDLGVCILLPMSVTFVSLLFQILLENDDYRAFVMNLELDSEKGKNRQGTFSSIPAITSCRLASYQLVDALRNTVVTVSKARPRNVEWKPTMLSPTSKKGNVSFWSRAFHFGRSLWLPLRPGHLYISW